MMKVIKNVDGNDLFLSVYYILLIVITLFLPFKNDGIKHETDDIFFIDGLKEDVSFPEPAVLIIDPLATAYLEECPGDEFNCTMYALEPIGRYYITAYSDLETGGKLTASGGTVHEGQITTCATDTKVLKFGTYIEVGGKIYRCEDTGSAVKGKHVDIFIHDLQKVKKYNSHHETIYRVTFPFGKPGDSYGETL